MGFKDAFDSDRIFKEGLNADDYVKIGDEIDPLTLQTGIDAYKNSDSAKEALKVLSFTTGVREEEAILNVVTNSSVKAVKTVLAALLLADFMDERFEALMRSLETLASIDYEEMKKRDPNFLQHLKRDES